MSSESVYFDTSVFNHIQKHWISSEDRIQLFSAIESGKLSVPLSQLCLEEAFCTYETDPKVAKEIILHILSLSDWRKLLKHPKDHLVNDITCYAHAQKNILPYENNDGNLQYLPSLLGPTPHYRDLIKDIKEEKDNFRASIERAREKVLPIASQYKGKTSPSFTIYWDGLSEKFAEDLAERTGLLEECRKRGIKGLLEVRSVRLHVGASLSYIYSLNHEKTEPHLGDSRDLLHAVSAAAVETFVTGDATLARILNRIPIDGLQVLKIQDFLNKFFGSSHGKR